MNFVTYLRALVSQIYKYRRWYFLHQVAELFQEKSFSRNFGNYVEKGTR